MRKQRQIPIRLERPAQAEQLFYVKPSDLRSENYTHVSAWTFEPLFRPESTRRLIPEVKNLKKA